MRWKVPAENQRRAAGRGRVGELLDNLQQQSGGGIGVFLLKRANRVAKTVRLNRADRGTAAGFVRRDGGNEPGNKHYYAYPYQSSSCLTHRGIIPCLSTQVGCTLDCAFCLTGRMGLLRNLQPQEILGQILAVQRYLSHPPIAPTHHFTLPPWVGQDRPSSSGALTNLVLMGMGEPL